MTASRLRSALASQWTLPVASVAGLALFLLILSSLPRSRPAPDQPRQAAASPPAPPPPEPVKPQEKPPPPKPSPSLTLAAWRELSPDDRAAVAFDAMNDWSRRHGKPEQPATPEKVAKLGKAIDPLLHALPLNHPTEKFEERTMQDLFDTILDRIESAGKAK